MSFDLSRVREAVPAARASVYLNAGTYGPLPRSAADAMRAHMDQSFDRGRIGNAGILHWIGLMDRARVAFAQTLGASPDEIALTHCTSDGCNSVVWGLSYAPGDEVVTTTAEHPGLTAPLEELARTRGVRVHEVEPTLEAIVAACSEKTRLVAISHVLWTNGDVLPVAEIAAAVRRKVGERVFVAIDGAQSVGAIPVDPNVLGVDAYTVSGQKWLCGPSGTGALWVRPGALAQLGTAWPSYFSKKRGPGEAVDWGSARRLDGSTVGMTSLAGVIAALEWHRAEWGQGGREHAARLADGLRARLADRRTVQLLPAPVPSQLVSFKLEGEGAASVAQRLENAGVLVRSIPGVDCVRASVGFWNDDADMDRLVSLL